MSLESAASRAADVIRTAPATTRWLVACDADADGLCGGAVVALALRRLGRTFTVRASRDKSEEATRLLLADTEGLILVDKGSSHLNVLAASAKRVVVLDHHNVGAPPPSVAVVNPRLEGLDGSRDASGATTAAAFALALCGEAALDWVGIALAGAMGDQQHEGGWRGWNQRLVERLGPRLGTKRVLPFHGPLGAKVASPLLSPLGISPDATMDDLDGERRTRLASAFLASRLAAGEVPDDPADLLESRPTLPQFGTLDHVQRIVDACGREGEAATAIAYLMGDKEAAKEAAACLARHQATMGGLLADLRERGLETRPTFRVGWTEGPTYTGLVASAAVANHQDRPVAILAAREDGAVQVSTRGTHDLVAGGLDLGRALAAAAHAAGGEGGGHPVAAGAVVPQANIEALLQALDAQLADQVRP